MIPINVYDYVVPHTGNLHQVIHMLLCETKRPPDSHSWIPFSIWNRLYNDKDNLIIFTVLKISVKITAQ